MIGIIDYGMGNLRSVLKGFEYVGAKAMVLADPRHVDQIDHLVLPGVGAFSNGMEHLRRGGWADVIRTFVETGKPFLGICLGMQLLFNASHEGATDPEQLAQGLSILPGSVVPFAGDRYGHPGLKVPHMGWNTLGWQRQDPLFHKLDQKAAVYFVHGYYVVPVQNPDHPITSCTTDYGQEICASVWHNNIWGTQFHPEKSQRIGLQVLSNFASA